ncbi:MAG: sulfite exporter TauE/SafE family protein [Acidobacteria bacterium]|nr:sulfite exporter TauE/SafE family protein [Spirochaetota bacterium]MBE3130297.1 sulfite exporter TauE/SafE family protein [Acidobacteriota bacterium]
MNLLLAAGSALWLGILTSISPCPLASNIAAVAWLGTRAGRMKGALAAGLLYTAGRVAAYVGLGLVLAAGALSLPVISQFLQTYGTRILGPLLILIGMFVLELIPLPLPAGGALSAAAERVKNWGAWAAPLLGFLFALSFCPVSAALFFGSLLPLALRESSPILLPALYGIGTGIPVLFFSLILAFGRASIAERLMRLARFETWARGVTGIVFIGAGVYLSLKYIFLLIP